jgi:hypothetical protein
MAPLPQLRLHRVLTPHPSHAPAAPRPQHTRRAPQCLTADTFYDEDVNLGNRAINVWHTALTNLVTNHLLPALDTAGHPVQTTFFNTIHNPVRSVDYGEGEPEWAYNITATVPEADVLTAVRELIS